MSFNCSNFINKDECTPNLPNFNSSYYRAWGAFYKLTIKLQKKCITILELKDEQQQIRTAMPHQFIAKDVKDFCK